MALRVRNLIMNQECPGIGDRHARAHRRALSTFGP
jgi:hypothetical protein